MKARNPLMTSGLLAILLISLLLPSGLSTTLARHQGLTQANSLHEALSGEEVLRHEIKLRGNVVDHYDGCYYDYYCWWVVDVEEVISGPPISGQISVVYNKGWAGCNGYADPNIQIGDRVEAYGLYETPDGDYWVDICDSSSYYIIEMSDAIPPSITNIRESNNPINKQGCPSPNTVTIRADVTDDSPLAWARLHYRPPGGSWTYATMSLESGNTYAATIGPFSQAGTLDYYVKARDNAGNEAQSSTRRVTINDCDSNPPSIGNIRESDDPINKQGCPEPTTVTIRADVTDDSPLTWVRLYYRTPGGSWTHATMSRESGDTYKATVGPFSQAGTLEYYVKARDNAGNEARSGTRTVTVNDCNECPTAQLSASPTTVEPRETVHLNACASSDSDGSVVSYRFDYGDGFDSGWVSQCTNDHVYADEGTYYAKVKVKDDDSCESGWSSSVEIKVITTGVVDLKVEDLNWSGTPIQFEPKSFLITIKNVGTARFEAHDGNYDLVLRQKGDDIPSLWSFPLEYYFSTEAPGNLPRLQPLDPGDSTVIVVSDVRFPSPVSQGKLEAVFKPKDYDADPDNNSIEKDISIEETPEGYYFCVGGIAKAAIVGLAAVVEVPHVIDGISLLDFLADTRRCQANTNCARRRIEDFVAGQAIEWTLPGVKIIALLRQLLEVALDLIRCLEWVLNLISDLIARLNARGIAVNAVAVESPVYVLVTNAQGEQVGFMDDGSIIQEIEGAQVLSRDDKKFILYPGSDTDTIRVKGAATGTFDLNLTLSGDEGVTAKVEYVDVPVTSATVCTVDARDEDYVMNVDENGDGIVDSTRPPDNITIVRPYRVHLPLVLNNHSPGPQPPITPTSTNTPTPAMSPTATPTPTPSTLLLNPGFEQGLLGWNPTGGTASYTIDSTTSVGGGYSAKGTEQSQGNLGRLYQDVTGRLGVGGRYKISGWIKTQNVTGRVVIGLDYVDSNGWTPGGGFVKEIGHVTGTTDWTYYESSPFTLPPMPRDATRLWFLFDFNAGSGTAWWDEVALVPVEEPTSTEARVLFDEAHGEGTSILTNYRELADNLRSNGYYVDRVTTRPITYDTLKDYEVFVIGNAPIAFDNSEVNAIVRFVQEGGGLFLAAQAWWWPPSGEGRTLDNFPPNIIGSNFGIRFLEDAIYEPSSYYPGCTCTPIFHPAIGHQVLSGVSSFGGPVVSSPITTTSTVAFPVLYGSASSYSNGGNFALGTFPPTVVAALHGSGRVVALGHEGYLSTDDYDRNGVSNLRDNDNLRLGLNIIDWLAKRSSQPLPWLETYFDKGSPEFGFVAWPGGLGAVRFTVPSGARIEKLRFYVWGDMDPVNVHILDRAWTPLLTQIVAPSPGWFEVDVSDANIITDGDFYVAWQWLQEASGGPWLGFDKTLPHHQHSYLGNLDPANPPHAVPDEDYVMRAVVSYPADIPAATPTPTPTLIPGLSPEDRRELPACLQTLSRGWVQSAVDRCNAILAKPEYDAAAWRAIFAEYFDANPFTDDLRNYLGYPVFWWFGEDAHLRLQMGLVAPMEANVEQIMENHSADLGPALAADTNLRQTLINSHRFLNQVLVFGVVNASTKQSIYDFYRAHIDRYPGFLRADVLIDNAAQPYVAVVRAQVQMNLRDAVPLTPQVKDEIAQTMGLSGRRLDIWDQSSVLVLDNLGLNSAQLDVIHNLLAAIPQSLHQLGAITQNDLLGNTAPSIWFASRSAVNIFDIDVGTSRENSFPGDIAPRHTDVFSIVLAHEVNHAVDANSVSPDPTLNARKDALIQQAGDNHTNYLRSMFEDGFFTQNPQEFFASIANQWFNDSRHTLDLGVSRFRNGYREPINQVLFFAEVYSKGGDTTRFYRLDTEGQIALTVIPVTRDVYGHINSLTIDGATYAFELDNAGNVVSILTAPSISALSDGIVVHAHLGAQPHE